MTVPASSAPALSELLDPLRELGGELDRAGHRSWLVGEALSTRLTGRAPSPWTVATSASLSELLALFPAAIPKGIPVDLPAGTPTTASMGELGRGVCAPGASGPVDLLPLPPGASLDAVLARADFTAIALGLDLSDASLIDPFGGRRDLEANVLRLVGDPGEKLVELPLRGLRAARLAAEWGASAAGDLESAMARHSLSPDALPRIASRRELLRLLAGPFAARGIALLRSASWESALVPGAPADTADLLAQLPDDLVLRTASWLRGTGSGSFLARWRFPEPLATEVRAVLIRHPLELHFCGRSVQALARRLKAVDTATLERLFTLREAEISLAVEPPRSAQLELARIREILDRAAADRERRGAQAELALDGREVMAILGCSPGPEVGRALAALRTFVGEDPRRNQRDRLARYLERWNG